MTERKINETIRFFTEQMDNYKSIAQRCHSDDREDEAVFAKIQCNVYGIFNSVFSVAVETAGQEEGKTAEFFLTRMEQIPRSWHTALANAEQRGETEKAHIERLKLDAVAKIRAEFARIWGISI